MLIGIRTALAPFFPLGYDATMASKDNKTSHSSKAEKTHFGFSTVNAIDKAKMVKGVFDNVASQYDLMNDLMSLGIHRLWKSAFIDYLDPHPQMKLIDVGGGTGDIAFKFLNSGGGHVTVCDINQEMLNVGQDRAINKGLLAGIDWINGDAEKLPMLGNTFDAYTTAFCIRNVTTCHSKVYHFAFEVLPPLIRSFTIRSFTILHSKVYQISF